MFLKIPIRQGIANCKHKKRRHMGCISSFYSIILLFTLFFLSGCATSPISKSNSNNIDRFPEFVDRDGSHISPASVDSSVPDVDILAVNDEIRSVLDESVVGIKDPWKRLNALTSLISKKVVYDTMDDKFGTKTAIETFESGTGNCLSFVNLFVAMARYVGLKSGYQDIQTPPNWIRNMEIIYITRHIGAFVDCYSLRERTIRVDFLGQDTIFSVSDNKDRYLIAPSLYYDPSYIYSYSNRSIPDSMGFAQYYNNIGSQYLAEGNLGAAYRYFIKAIKTYPGLGFAWSNLGVVYSWNNQLDAAEKAYLQAISLRGRDDISLLTVMSNMEKLYNKSGRKEDAAVYAKKVVSFRDKNPYYHFSIGRIAFDDGHLEESVEEFKEAIRRKDDEHIFHFALALSYIRLNDLKSAEKSLKKARSWALDREQREYYDRVLEDLNKKDTNDQKTTG